MRNVACERYVACGIYDIIKQLTAISTPPIEECSKLNVLGKELTRCQICVVDLKRLSKVILIMGLSIMNNSVHYYFFFLKNYHALSWQ